MDECTQTTANLSDELRRQAQEIARRRERGHHREFERAELERRVRDRGALARGVTRARIVLLSSQG